MFKIPPPQSSPWKGEEDINPYPLKGGGSSVPFPFEGGRGWGCNQGDKQMTRISPHTKQRSRALRRDQTDAERFLWKRLRKKQILGYKFRRQHPLGNYILDFVCLEARLVIEVDGSQHSNDEYYDEKRTRYLDRSGFRVLRFWNNEVLEDPDSVLEIIYRELERDILPPPGSSP